MTNASVSHRTLKTIGAVFAGVVAVTGLLSLYVSNAQSQVQEA